MNISVFGLGYVGCVGIACLADLGHNMIGVDVEPIKVNNINKGLSTIVEKDIDDLIMRNHKAGKIKAVLNGAEAVEQTEVSIICVGTPNDVNGHLNMQYIYNVAAEIGRSIKKKSGFHTVAIRSTVMPGTNAQVEIIIEKESGKKVNKNFAVVSNPEFLREGVAVSDFYNPPYTVLASNSELGIDMMKNVYEKINAEIIITEIGTAEMIKLVNNSFHALKVSFGNEVGRICKSLNIDSHALMNLFVKDTRLNISPLYFKPGFAYGGSCLPKDLKALNSIAHDKYVNIPVISSIETSNKVHIDYAVNMIIKNNKKKIGLYGLSFKPGTDDLRFSPALEVAERLIGKGYEVKIYDKNVNLTCLMGKNKEYIFNKLPHINNLLCTDFYEFITSIEVLVLSTYDNELMKYLDNGYSMTVIDYTRIDTGQKIPKQYDGICW